MPMIPLTNAEMKQSSVEEKQSLDRRMENLTAQLESLLDARELDAFRAVQHYWESYRDAIQAYARIASGTGSNAGLSALNAWISETERRVDEITEELLERQSRCG